MKQVKFESVSGAHGMLTRDETEGVLSQLNGMRSCKGKYMIRVSSSWSSDIKWARNRANMTSDRRSVQVHMILEMGRSRGSLSTNQIDSVSLEGAMRALERHVLRKATLGGTDMQMPLPSLGKLPEPLIWSDKTMGRTVEDAAQIVDLATSQAEEHSLMSAGYIESHGMTTGLNIIDVHDRVVLKSYGAMSQAQCSATVRDSKGTASGWAGLARYDLDKIDERFIAARALEKCIASLNPVRIEPGRYTAILEPQATADLVHPVIESFTSYLGMRLATEGTLGHSNPYILGENTAVNRIVSKLGTKIVDERVTISHDPMDPELGIIPSSGTVPVKWIDKGVLTGLSYGRDYGLQELNDGTSVDRRTSLRMEGGGTSLDEMIESTKRGLLVSRLYNMRMLSESNILMSGVTRDGLWLIEDGRISKPVRNFRITESPLFALNNLDQLGTATPVYKPFPFRESASWFTTLALTQVIVPAIKVHDFSFTSSIEAV